MAKPNVSLKRPLVSILAGLLLSTVAVPAFAQEKGTQLITGFAGQLSFDAFGQIDDDVTGVELEGGWNFGGRYQYHLTSHWAVEANVMYSPAEVEFELFDDDFEGNDDDDGDNDNGDDDDGFDDDDGNATYFTGNVVYNFWPDRKLMPFVTAGAGIVRSDPTGDDASSELTGVFGGGVLYNATDQLAFRFDIRDYIHSVELGPLAGGILQDETVNNLSITGGVSFRF